MLGIWRPKVSGKKFSVRLILWEPTTKPVQARIEEEALRLALHRGLVFAGIV